MIAAPPRRPALTAFWQMPVADSLAVLAVILTFAFPTKSGVRPAHMVATLFMIVSLINIWHKSIGRPSLVAMTLFFTVIFTSSVSAILNGPGMYFPEQVVRNLILFGAIFVGSHAMTADRLRPALTLAPYLCIGLIIAIFVIMRNPFSYGGRLAFGEYFFAPGLSYAILLCLAVALTVERKRWFHYCTIGFLVLADALTFTRAEIISLVILFWMRIGFVRGLTLMTSIIVPLALFDSQSQSIKRLLIIQDVLSTGGSGRADVWTSLISDYLNTPGAWLFGFGPGHVNFIVSSTESVDKAHSIPLDTLYSYGIFGFLALLVLVVILLKNISWGSGNKHQMLARDIVIVTGVNAMVNGSFYDGALNGLAIIFFSYVITVMREYPADEAAQVPNVISTA